MLTYQGVVARYEHGSAGRMLGATAEEGCGRTGVVVQPLANLQTSKENVSVARNSILRVLSRLQPSRQPKEVGERALTETPAGGSR